jgi:3-phenylpropionate/trans-cinnamate dioxygenase ferredoxin reductase component
VVVGASLAGLRCAEALRREGFTGALTIVGAEQHLPYDRPPLSKEFLTAEFEEDRLALRTEPYEDLEAELLLGKRAQSLSLEARSITLASGEKLDFDGLVIATGAAPRTLPIADGISGVMTLRTLDDALRLKGALADRKRICVIGAGFIGSEVAATARGLGLDVTVLEAGDQPMLRGVGPIIGETLAELHRSNGVDLRTGVKIESLEQIGESVRVNIAEEASLECDLVLLAVGAAPVTQWLEGSGLALDDGVVCDATLLAAPGVVCAGDIARWPNPLFGGESMRVEHWTNAVEQGVHAARRLLSDDESAPEFSTVPFVWSEQYGIKIQAAGRFSGEDRMEVVHSGTDDARLVAIFERHGRISGVIGFSEPRRVMQYRRLIGAGTFFDEALAASL